MAQRGRFPQNLPYQRKLESLKKKNSFFATTEAGMLLKTMRASREPPDMSMKTRQLDAFMQDFRISI
jgi:hypothetical protein